MRMPNEGGQSRRTRSNVSSERKIDNVFFRRVRWSGIRAISTSAPARSRSAGMMNKLSTRVDNLFIIPADLDLAGAEVEIARMPDHLTRLARTLSTFRSDETFDLVLFDCPPSLGILMTNALAAADEILTPIQCEYFALEGLVKIVRVVGQVVDEVRQHFGRRVHNTVIPRTVRLSEAPSFGKSILEYDPSGAGASAYRALAREFIRRHAPAAIARETEKTHLLESLDK